MISRHDRRYASLGWTTVRDSIHVVDMRAPDMEELSFEVM